MPGDKRITITHYVVFDFIKPPDSLPDLEAYPNSHEYQFYELLQKLGAMPSDHSPAKLENQVRETVSAELRALIARANDLVCVIIEERMHDSKLPVRCILSYHPSSIESGKPNWRATQPLAEILVVFQHFINCAARWLEASQNLQKRRADCDPDRPKT